MPQRLVGQDLAGFQITEVLGEGGMGWVLRGENLLNRRIVRAIKILRPELSANAEFEKRFVREAAVLASIDHPNVMRFYGVRRADEYLLMEVEFLEGRSVRQILDSAPGPMDLRPAVDIARQVAEGVAAAHGVNVVHRDIKPENVLVTNRGDVKVLDFGIARAMEEAARITRTRTRVGTPAYLAPEVLQGEPASPRSDVYAIALVLYEMLLGAHPFRPNSGQRGAADEWQLMEAILKGAATPLRSVRSDIPASVELFLGKGVSRRPDERPGSAREAAALLAAILTNDPSRRGVPLAAIAKDGRPGAPTPPAGTPPARKNLTELGVALPSFHTDED